MSDARTKSTTPKAQARRRNSRPDVSAAAPPMPMPMPTADEQASERKLLQQMKDLADLLQRRNLDSAVQLAIQASKGEGPLVDHFMELGRRFGGELRNARWKAPQPARKKTLRVIDGGNKGGVA